MPRAAAVDLLRPIIQAEYPSQARFAKELGTKSPVVTAWLSVLSRQRANSFFRVAVEIVTRGKVPREAWDYPSERLKLERLAKRFGYDLQNRKPLHKWKGANDSGGMAA